MLSKQQFLFLVDGLKKQSEFENEFNKCFELLNSSFTVLDLSHRLSNGIFSALEEDFTTTGVDCICDYLYNDQKEFCWREGNSFDEGITKCEVNITNISDLYDMLDRYFRNKNKV